MMTEGYDLICVLGPTASGKTRYAVALARELGGEILSGDSRQVYRGMDIICGKGCSGQDHRSFLPCYAVCPVRF